MSPPNKQRGPGVSAPKPLKNGDAGQAISKAGDNTSGVADQDRVLIDKHGHLHSKIILTAWSPAALKVLGVRWIDGRAL